MEKSKTENLINYRVNTLGKFSGSVLTMHIDCNLCIITPTDIYNTHIYTHNSPNKQTRKKRQTVLPFYPNDKLTSRSVLNKYLENVFFPYLMFEL